ncbi:MAG TPA: tetratricopeptide repeat-containing sensor histidine kinase [Puia sp.]|jgi:signal transduction histidine kinase
MKSILLAFLVFLVNGVSAQKNGQSLIDSLVAGLPALKEDSDKVKAYGRVAATYMQVDQQKGFNFIDSGLQLSEKLHWKKGIANLYNNKGLMIGDTGNNTLARDHFERSYVLNKELGSKINQVNNLNNIGRSYQRESNFSQAMEYYYKALALAEEIKNDQKIGMVATNITVSFLTQKNYPKATEYAEMTVKHGELAKAPDDVAKALLFLGIIKMDTKDTGAAKSYMEKAFRTYKEMNNKPQMAEVLVEMAELEYPDHKKVIEKMLAAQDILDTVSPGSLSAIANITNLGGSYYDMAMQSKQPDRNTYLQQSERYLLRGIDLCKRTGNAEYLSKIYLSLADLEETKGNYKSALDHYKSWSATNDSLYSQDKKNELAGLDGKYKIALKDKEIAFDKLTLSDQRRTQIGLIAGLLLSGIIGGLLYWQGRNRKKTNTTLMVLNDQLDEANKVKAKFFGILSHDLRGPVANLIHFLHLQKNDPDLLEAGDPAVHQQMISQSAEDLLNNMEAMLLWSKEQMEDFKPNIKTVAVSDLFDHLQKFFPQTGAIQLQFTQEPGLVVLSDENYLQVIMQNLTSNALKALQNSSNGKIEWKAGKDGGSTILSVTDNGPGISDEQIKVLYEEGSSLNAKTGFGLHLIRDLAKAIRYRITIRSQPGMGTTFTLTNA